MTSKKTKITPEQFDPKKHIKEIKCKCNQCGKVWHYLGEEEKRVKGQMCWSAYGQMTCCLPIQLYSKQQGGKWEQELDKFKKCQEPLGNVGFLHQAMPHIPPVCDDSS